MRHGVADSEMGVWLELNHLSPKNDRSLAAKLLEGAMAARVFPIGRAHV